MKKTFSKIWPMLLVLVGICGLFYPFISNYLYDSQVSDVITSYEEKTDTLSEESIQAKLEEAQRYNVAIAHVSTFLTDDAIEKLSALGYAYDDILSIDDSGYMCSIEIPKIAVNLPVYHGTSTEVLKAGVGHIEGSSMPVGGETTRAILSAHTGTSSAKLFTDLTELEDGDIFLIHVLGETLAYRVCQTDIVLPSDITEFPLEEGRDLVSLVTCYPYGVNTHRLVVTGERTEYTESLQEELDGVTVVTSNAWAQDYIRALIIAGVCFALFVGLYVVNNIGNKKKNVKRKNMTPDPNALANAPVQMLMRPTASEEEKKK